MPLRPSSSQSASPPSGSSPTRGSTAPPAKPAKPAATAPSGTTAVPSLIPQGAHAGKPAMPLQRPFILIGSRNRAHVHLVSQTVSRAHAAIINTEHGSYVRDLGSRTHTFVNGRPMKEAALHHADAVQVGSFQFRYSDKSGRGSVEEAPRARRAVIHAEGVEQPVAIEGWTLLIGQKPVCDVYIADAAVSTAHAIIFELNGRHYVRDLGSRTGTLVNGRPAHQEVLEYGDEIRIGPAVMRYASADADADQARLDEDEHEEAQIARDAEPLAGTGVGVAATTAIGTAAAMDEPPLDLTVTEPEHDLVATTPEAAGLQIETGEIEPFPLEAELPPIPMAPDVNQVETEEPIIPLAAEPDHAPEPVAMPEPVAEVKFEPEPQPELPPPVPQPLPPLPPLAGPEGSSTFWPHAPAPESALPEEAVTEADIFGTSDLDTTPTGTDAGLSPGSALPPVPVAEATSEAREILEDRLPSESVTDEPAPAADAGVPIASAPAAPADELPIPLDESEPSLADLEALAGPLKPISSEDSPSSWQPPQEPAAEVNAPDFSAPDFSATAPAPTADVSPAGRAGATPGAPADEANSLDLALDFPPESESATDLAAELTGEPFGPLTDMNLMSHLEPSPAGAAERAEAPALDPAPDPEAMVAPEAVVAPAAPITEENRAGELEEFVAPPPMDEEPGAPGAAADLGIADTASRPAETVGTYADLGLRFEGEPTPEPPGQPAAREPEVSATTSAEAEPMGVDDAAVTFAPPSAPVEELPPSAPLDETPFEESPIEEVPTAEVPPEGAPATLEAPPAVEPPAPEPTAPEPTAPAIDASTVAALAAAGATVIEAGSAAAAAAGVAPAVDAAPVALDIAVEVATDAAGALAAPASEEAPTKGSKRRRKSAAPKAPAAPKKKRWWGKKAGEAAAAEAAAAEATPAQTPSVEAQAAETAEVARSIAAEAPFAPSMPPEPAEVPLHADADETSDAVPPPAQGATVPFAEPVEETVAPTEPTPESALDLSIPDPIAESIAEPSETPAGAGARGTDEATDAAAEFVSTYANEDAGATPDLAATAPPPSDDAAFDALLAEFSGPSTGPIVEESPATEAGAETSPEPPAAPEPAVSATTAEELPDLSLPDEVSDEVSAEPMPVEPMAAQPESADPMSSETPAPPADENPPLDLTLGDVAQYDEPRLEDLEGLEPPPAQAHQEAESFAPPATPASASPASAASASPPAPMPFDPFRGMGRDEGSFIGGLPLDFGRFEPIPEPNLAAPPPPPAATQPPTASRPSPGQSRPGAISEPDLDLPPLDDLPSLDDLESVEPKPAGAAPVSATASPGADPRGGGAATTPSGLEPDLDLSLPELPDLDAPLPPPGAGTGAGGTTTATAPADALDTSLDLPDLPPLDLSDAPPAAGEHELPSFDPPADFAPASPAAGPGGASAGKVDEPADPLTFTEAEAETLQLLPRPEAPGAGRGGSPPRGAPTAGQQPPPARGDRPRPTPPPPARAGRAGGAQPYPSKTPPPARGGGGTRRPVRNPFDLDADLGAEFDIPPAVPPLGGKPASPATPAKPVRGAGGAAVGAFAGLAMPPVREADVFSPLSFGASDVIPPVHPRPAGASDKPAQPIPGQNGPGGGEEEDLAAALNLPPAGTESDLGLGSGLGASRTGEASAPILGLTGLASAPPGGRRAGRRAGTSPRDIGRGVAPGAPPGMPPAVPEFGVDRWDAPGVVPKAGPAPDGAHGHGHAARPTPVKRRVGIGLLLVLMIASLVGVSLGIWYLGPKPEIEVVGKLQFDRLRDLTTYERQSFEQRQQKILGDPDFRRQAREILKVADESMAYGFLGEDVDSVKAYEKLVAGARAKERTNDFVVYYRGHDRLGDKPRMQAVLKALAARNAPAKDEAAGAERKYQEAQDALKAATQRIEERKKLIASMREQGEKMPQLEQQLKQLQAEDQKINDAAKAARREVIRLQAELDQAEGPPAAPGQARPAQGEDGSQAGADEPADGAGQLVAISSKASAVPAVDAAQDLDPQVRQWRIQLDQLRAAAVAARAERARRLERASKSLDAALEQFNAEVGEAGKKLQGESPLESQLRRYVAAGQRMQDALRSTSAELDRQQKADREFLNDMKRRLAEKSESRLKDAWANDADLRGMEDELAIAERHRNAARGGGLKQEVAALDAKIAELGRQIETRRDLVGTGRAYTGDVQEIQDFIDRTLKRMEDERALSERRMEGLLAGFAAEAPAAEKLPDGQKKLAEGLGKRSAELADARRGYAAALAAADAITDADADKQEQQAAALQAKIATRRRQVAVLVAQEQLTDQQRKDRQAKIEKLRRDLKAAQDVLNRATTAADASADALSKARLQLADARESADKIAAAQRQQVADEQGLETVRAQGERLQRELAKMVRPVEPGDDAVQVNNGEDPRPLRILYAGAAIVAVFSFLMWFAATGGNTPPVAERATYDVLGQREAKDATVRRAANGTNPADDDEQPLTV